MLKQININSHITDEFYKKQKNGKKGKSIGNKVYFGQAVKNKTNKEEINTKLKRMQWKASLMDD